MMNQQNIPQFVRLRSGGISSRFAKVCGRSGRNYIVTEVPASLLNSYHDCIAIAVVRERIAGVWLACDGWQPEAEFVRPQMVTGRGYKTGSTGQPVRWFLHFLSGSDPHAIEDLRPSLSVTEPAMTAFALEARHAA